jgi:hypothetical protein
MMADVVQSEIQQQAADQVSISNSITSLRLLDKLDWREFVESTSVVESILRQIPRRFTGEWILPRGISIATQ